MPTYALSSCSPVAALVVQFFLTGLVAAQTDLFIRLDTNNDGQISAAEIPDEHAPLLRRMLRTADANTDGQLSTEEFVQGLSPERPEKPLTEKVSPELPGSDALLLMLAWMDKNSDLTIKAEEVPANLEPLYDLFQQQLKTKDAGQIRVRQLQQQSPRYAQIAQRYAQRQQIDVELELSLLSEPQYAMVERLRKNTEPGQGASPRENAEALFNRLDQDGDGVIMVSDLPDGPREIFAEILQRADRNRDERITVEEFLSARNLATMALVRNSSGPPDGRRIVQLLRRADRNGDGQLTRRESPPFLAERFDRFDADGNGRLDREELSKILELQNSSPKSTTSPPPNRKSSSKRPKK